MTDVRASKDTPSRLYSTSAQAKSETLSNEVGRTAQLTLLGIIAGVILALGIGFYAFRAWLAVPISRLATLMARLANGDMEVEVVGDEIVPSGSKEHGSIEHRSHYQKFVLPPKHDADKGP